MFYNIKNKWAATERKDFSWTYTMIKAKQYFVDFRWKNEFDSKTDEWVSQDLHDHMMVSVWTIHIWLTLKFAVGKKQGRRFCSTNIY